MLSIFIWNVSARTVEYEYIGSFNDRKDMQTMGELQSDKDLRLTEWKYTIYDTVSSWIEIPKYTPFEQKLIEILGYEKLNNFINKDIIHLEWSEYRFISEKERKKLQPDFQYPIQIEDKEVLETNIYHNRAIRIESEKNQEVTFQLFPVPPAYYTWDYARELESYPEDWAPDKSRFITVYDTRKEYYNIAGSISNNLIAYGEERKQPYVSKNLQIEKKYEIFTFKRKLSNGDVWESKSVIPYYEFKAKVTKWVNVLNLYYRTHKFEWEPLEIR